MRSYNKPAGNMDATFSLLNINFAIRASLPFAFYPPVSSSSRRLCLHFLLPPSAVSQILRIPFPHAIPLYTERRTFSNNSDTPPTPHPPHRSSAPTSLWKDTSISSTSESSLQTEHPPNAPTTLSEPNLRTFPAPGTSPPLSPQALRRCALRCNRCRRYGNKFCLWTFRRRISHPYRLREGF